MRRTVAKRKRANATLTELEGAALSVIYSLGPCTPYQVRQAFLGSRSREWSGSAGAVYPALRRLHANGLLLKKDTGDSRRSVLYSLSQSGNSAFAAWLRNAQRAAGSGLDPFRCRADYWDALPKRERRAMECELIEARNGKCVEIARLLKSSATPESQALLLELELHRTRLRWLRARVKRVRNPLF